MPISIYNDRHSEELAWLCNDDWELPSQVETLEKWLLENKNIISAGDYIADIAFDIRQDASGGGSVLSVEAMSIMVKLGITLYSI